MAFIEFLFEWVKTYKVITYTREFEKKKIAGIICDMVSTNLSWEYLLSL